MLNTLITSTLSVSVFLICTAVSVILGIGCALISKYKSCATQSFAVTLAILPVTVQTVIMLVNGNIGAGVAVAGAFSLVRFRSAPGTAREIAVIFLAMALGLATGMGYIYLAIILFCVVAAVMLILIKLGFSENDGNERILKITIPENLDFDGLFDDVFEKYLTKHSLEKVKTSNMGTLYELQYNITFKNNTSVKAFIDEIRCRNGNLNIVCSKVITKESL